MSFNIDLIGVCDEKLEADRDPTYDESTDPNAPANTKSQTTEIESSTLALSQCDIETELVFNNANQTKTLGHTIQTIITDVTIGSACTEKFIVSLSNFQEGITASLDNNKISIDRTPSSDSAGSFDYGIILNQADTEVILRGY